VDDAVSGDDIVRSSCELPQECGVLHRISGFAKHDVVDGDDRVGGEDGRLRMARRDRLGFLHGKSLRQLDGSFPDKNGLIHIRNLDGEGHAQGREQFASAWASTRQNEGG